MARMILRDAILSYPNLFQPQPVSAEDAAKGKKPKYSAAFVFPDASTDQIKAYKKAALEVAKQAFGDKIKGAKLVTLETQHGPAIFLKAGNVRLRMPWNDNAEVLASKGYPEGGIFLNARSGSKPGVVSIFPGEDGKPAPITDEANVYPGVIVNVSLDLFSYNNSGNRGVAAGLGNVQVVRDGERLDSRVNAKDEFDADTDAVADLSDLTADDDEDLVAAAAEDSDDLSDLIG